MYNREYHKDYYQKNKEAIMERRNTPEYRENRRLYNKRHREKTKSRKKAHKKVENAIKFGTLKRQPCEECGNEDSHAHHDDYDKPLDVRWLCAQHHKEVHLD